MQIVLLERIYLDVSLNPRTAHESSAISTKKGSEWVMAHMYNETFQFKWLQEPGRLTVCEVNWIWKKGQWGRSVTRQESHALLKRRQTIKKQKTKTVAFATDSLADVWSLLSPMLFCALSFNIYSSTWRSYPDNIISIWGTWAHRAGQTVNIGGSVGYMVSVTTYKYSAHRVTQK